MRLLLVILCVAVLTAAAGCVKATKHAGVSNTWRKARVQFVVGQTTESDVLRALGPPSQVVPLNGRTVFYYLLEQVDDTKMILVVYNKIDTRVAYDRAVFFFDANGVLTDGVFSGDCFPYVDMSPCEDPCD
jgi:hypothetical protein